MFNNILVPVLGIYKSVPIYIFRCAKILASVVNINTKQDSNSTVESMSEVDDTDNSSNSQDLLLIYIIFNNRKNLK